MLAELWNVLEVGSAPKAYEAIGKLIASPRPALDLLARRLRAVPPVSPARLRQLIADLGSETVSVRDEATRQLANLGPAAEPALRAALARRPPLELRLRLQRLLRAAQAPWKGRSREELAHARAIQVLEGIRNREARALLQRLAEGADGAPRTQDAREALRRLETARR
jgi:hypothetical protein